MRRQRGFTLMEILIAMALTTIVTASVLAIVRTQLSAFEMNDQIVRAQQGTRAGVDFVETILRRACGGVSTGVVSVYTPSLTNTAMPCVRLYDGVSAVSATSFTTGSATTMPDAIEVIYATGTMTAVSGATGNTIATTTPVVNVLDTSSFSVGDYVILTDKNFANPAMFKVTAVTGSGNAPRAGALSLGTLGAAPTTVPTIAGYVAGTTEGTPVFKAQTYSIFVAPSTAGTYANMLMIDPDGVCSTNHLDYGGKVQPIVEGAVDFQVAVGNDTSGDGIITESTASPSTDEWIGNASSDTMPATPWTTLKQIRASLLLQTINSYAGTAGTITAMEDRTTYPATTNGAYAPRYRSMRITVAPREWNLTE